MSLRKRSSSKPSSGRASNKMRLNNNGGIVEIKSWVDFAQNYDSYVEQLINPSQLSIKKNLRNQFMNYQLQRREISKCLKTKLLASNTFWIQKICRWNALKMDEQKKLLSHLFLSQKSNNTSLPIYQSIKINHDKCETKSNRDQSKVMEHKIEVPELFHDPYPFEKFEANQLPHLEKESLKFYKEQLKFSDKD